MDEINVLEVTEEEEVEEGEEELYGGVVLTGRIPDHKLRVQLKRQALRCFLGSEYLGFEGPTLQVLHLQNHF